MNVPSPPRTTALREIPLAETLAHILGSIPGTPIQDLGRPVEGPADLPLECGIRLSGGPTGLLVVRTNSSLSSRLRESQPGSDDRRAGEREALNGLAVLLCINLLVGHWKPSLPNLGPILPRPSTPRDWPARPPDAACAFLADKDPVEARLWIEERSLP
jgi:hypothetical protein